MKKKVKQTKYSTFPAENAMDSGDPTIQIRGKGDGTDPIIPRAEAPFGKAFTSPKK